MFQLKDLSAVSRRASFYALLACVTLFSSVVVGGPYVTEPSGIRWNEVGGIRWNEVGGIRWNEVGGIRWNEVGGGEWTDTGDTLQTPASGARWTTTGGLRWNDASGIEFDDATVTGETSHGLDLLSLMSVLPDSSSINVIVSYFSPPTQQDLDDLVLLGIAGGTKFDHLPMVVINATKQQIRSISALPNVRSIYSDGQLSLFEQESNDLIGVSDVANDPRVRAGDGSDLDGSGITIAVIDTGTDTGHPDLPLGTKVVDNVRLLGSIPVGPGFVPPQTVNGLANTDLVLGHGTFVASVAAGSGAASGGLYAGTAPGSSILSLSAGDVFIVNMLEGFDYVLGNATQHNVRVVNCSWGSSGWFDPDDPVNIATRALFDAGINVVFAAGNHGSALDSLNKYSVAPWVIGVGSTDLSGQLSDFSSRGIYEELIYHPTLVAPGEGIIAARAGATGSVGGIVGVADPSGGRSVPAQYAADYVVASGTSFAAPHVAGVIARMLQADPSLQPESIKRQLQQAATPMPALDRAAVGAGRVDTWGALAVLVAGAGPFGDHIAQTLDLRAFDIVHAPAVETSHTLTPQSTLSIPGQIEPDAIAWQVHIAWGTEASASQDLDLRVLDDLSNETASSTTLNGAGLFGRMEGVGLNARLDGELPDSPTLEVFFKAGTGTVDQPFHLRQESATADLVGLDDLASLTPEERAVVARVVVAGVMLGRGSNFEPQSALTRGEFARSLALAGSMPQRVPQRRSFRDVRSSDANRPYIETVAGERARKILLDDVGARRFQPSWGVRRIDFAVGMVRAANLEDEADQRAGETLGLIDEAAIPARLRGYAAVALDNGFIDAVDEGLGPAFLPTRKITRLQASSHLLELLDAPQGASLSPSAGPGRRGQMAPIRRRLRHSRFD